MLSRQLTKKAANQTLPINIQTNKSSSPVLHVCTHPWNNSFEIFEVFIEGSCIFIFPETSAPILLGRDLLCIVNKHSSQHSTRWHMTSGSLKDVRYTTTMTTTLPLATTTTVTISKQPQQRQQQQWQ